MKVFINFRNENVLFSINDCTQSLSFFIWELLYVRIYKCVIDKHKLSRPMDHITHRRNIKLKHQDYSYDYASTLVKRRNTERVYSLSEESIVHLQKKEKKKNEPPVSNDALCQVWLKVVQWFLRRIWKAHIIVTSPWKGNCPSFG